MSISYFRSETLVCSALLVVVLCTLLQGCFRSERDTFVIRVLYCQQITAHYEICPPSMFDALHNNILC
jgi:hypothetical protein